MIVAVVTAVAITAMLIWHGDRRQPISTVNRTPIVNNQTAADTTAAPVSIADSGGYHFIAAGKPIRLRGFVTTPDSGTGAPIQYSPRRITIG